MNRILQDHAFRVHLITYVAVDALLLAINLVTSPNKLWFYWPLLGWGIGILGHAFAVYRKAGMPEVTKPAVTDVHPTPSPTVAATAATAPAARIGPTQNSASRRKGNRSSGNYHRSERDRAAEVATHTDRGVQRASRRRARNDSACIIERYQWRQPSPSYLTQRAEA